MEEKVFEKIRRAAEKYNDNLFVNKVSVIVDGKEKSGYSLEFDGYVFLIVYNEDKKEWEFILEDDTEGTILAEGNANFLDDIINIWLRYGKYLKKLMRQKH